MESTVVEKEPAASSRTDDRGGKYTAKVEGKVKILLEIDRVLTSQDLHGLEAVLR